MPSAVMHAGVALMQSAAAHIDRLAARLMELGVLEYRWLAALHL